jgi:preprotein translocase subunit YajC
VEFLAIVSPAYAQAGAEVTGPGGLEAFLPIILIFVVFYFLLIRPQQKKMKQHKEMLAAIRRGDRIVTGGGIIGTVSKVIDDQEVQVEIAEGVRVRVQRALIASVLAKTEPVPAAKETAANDGVAGGDTGGDESQPEGKAPPARGSGLRRMLGGKRE